MSFRQEVRLIAENRIEDLMGIGCTIYLQITPARRQEIAERIEPALMSGWTVVSDFHRERQPRDGPPHDIYWHQVRTHNDRVDVGALLEFGERFAEIDDQLKIERAREGDPEFWQQLVEDHGRDRAIDMILSTSGGGAGFLRISARMTGETADTPRTLTDDPGELDLGGDERRVEPMLEVDFSRNREYPGDEVFRDMVLRRFMGELVRVEPSETGVLLGGAMLRSVEDLGEAMAWLGEELGVGLEDVAVVCRVFRVRDANGGQARTVTGP